MRAMGFSAIFIHDEQKSEALLREVAEGRFRVVFICPEMLETPRMAQVLHSTTFKAVLQAVYIDEAHLIRESLTWRPAYTRLHQLRNVIGQSIPIVSMSATLPASYRT